jgi:hypothetical protein
VKIFVPQKNKNSNSNFKSTVIYRFQTIIRGRPPGRTSLRVFRTQCKMPSNYNIAAAGL